MTDKEAMLLDLIRTSKDPSRLMCAALQAIQACQQRTELSAEPRPDSLASDAGIEQ